MPIRISSAINGFRRAGVAHPSEPTVYPDGYFSDKQVEQLKKEPRLAVEFGDFEDPDQADPTADQAGAVESDDVSGDLTGHLDGVVEPDGTQKPLEEMTVADLRGIAKDMEIDGYTSLKKAELVEAIRATEVSVSADEA